ncbi:MAG: hypothetical protein NTY48_06570 [Candidatus Diapherotrites archaeon]|nr:hypothetical protein [Candidatus Diapherotrites archaeon]
MKPNPFGKVLAIKYKSRPWVNPRKKVQTRSYAVWEAAIEGYPIPKTKKQHLQFNRRYRAGEELESFHFGGASAKKRRKIVNNAARYFEEPRRSGSEKTRAALMTIRSATAKQLREKRREREADKALEKRYWARFKKK